MRLVIGYEVDDSDYSSTVLRSLGEIHAEASLKSSAHLAAVRSCGLKRNIFLLRAVSLPCSCYKPRKQAIVWRKSDPSAGKAGRLLAAREAYMAFAPIAAMKTVKRVGKQGVVRAALNSHAEACRTHVSVPCVRACVYIRT